jgi:hypothetical protein
MTNVLYTLLGGVLVVFGVMAAALADRVRGIRVQRASERQALAPRATIPVERETEPEPERVKPQAARPRAETRMREMADDVIAALVESGYKKTVAAEAAWGCGAAERATIESWTMAALRRAGKGAPS